jgi:uncharacterized protein (UPF0332 family)
MEFGKACVTWKEISRENLIAAKSLALDSRWRSSVSRAYYAAYAMVASELEGLAQYPKGRFGPSHDLLPQLVMTYLTEIRIFERRKVSTAAHRLYIQRINADYKPMEIVAADEARSAIRDSVLILRRIKDAKN